MPRLEQLRKQLDGTLDKEREQRQQEVRSAVNPDAVTSKILTALNSAENKSASERRQLAEALGNQLFRLIGEAHNAQMRRADATDKAHQKEAQLTRENFKTLIGGTEQAVLQKLVDVVDLVKSKPDVFPETDLTGVSEMLLSVTDRINAVESKVEGIKIPKIPKQKEKWTFKVVRDDQDLIKHVVVT